MIDVPASKYWGAGTERILKAAPASPDHIPERFYAAYGYVKRAAAMVNVQAGRLPAWKSQAIVQAADDLIAGRLAGHFPLPIWQSGSGRDADTNVNEVLANRATQLAGKRNGGHGSIDPAQDVNLGQDLGQACTTTMQVATVIEIEDMLLPRARSLLRALDRHPSPLSLHAIRLQSALARLDEAEGGLHEIGVNAQPPEQPAPTGQTAEGAASGTPGHGAKGSAAAMTTDDLRIMAGIIAADTARPFIASQPGTPEDASVDAMVAAMGALRGLAVILLDMVSGPAMSPGEDRRLRPALSRDIITMICLQVLGRDHLVTAAASRRDPGPSQMRPLIISAVLHSIQDLGIVCETTGHIVAYAR